MRTFYLEIITPKSKIFSADIQQLTVPTMTGEITVLANHAPLITPLVMGEIRLLDNHNKQKLFSIGKGLLEVSKEKVVLLIESVLQGHEISLQKALAAKKRAVQLLKDPKLKGKQLLDTKTAFRRSLIDLKVARKQSGRRFQPQEQTLTNLSE
ncbi:ATP synthase F1 subunit epsilon [Patescibacteria group bacterium]|nr:ATP synthase F1 subunit epsilon [Patescibacteria group bacterium]MBU1931906.1 ATP synthase F1 subunit epsilon [Patescibacteria group bacterium]